ncbi:sensor histidine kinase [Clostridium saccharobutylicum]|uniref:histidine kinase n=1 Tax=Clostridium saccharobutylicum DSM 13864 TaxID=1345695 RepID=U5MQU8_CLOSA|nr:sensor histidine kinase [Clostridium saccharobutylicum]AGX42955.1 sensor histidine kinase YpdA [Clostridium saccharobutylicum DSM 13864]AQR90248.1 sensor histidine kinase YpdA [Clostridium saccharobutylicum]AQS00154.1 sensor histidine kinase YpdA [Clostridium saccharobutylicum]AQS14137.1 sensor histidine kinase YpdA [Clostridium saccharobutylicum]MBA2905431.1 two-component system LytT family sensor kinase [Clostridium saccharobutylicum]
MNYVYNILGQFVDRVALLLMCLFVITRLRGFREIFRSDNYSKKGYLIASIVFSIFAIMANYTGLNVEGSLVNVRTITIVSGGIIFGPVVGIVAGVISGIHRYLIDIGGITSIPCLISSITAGIISGYINKKIQRNYRWIFGIIAGVFSETITMILILLLSRPLSLGLDIVSKIALPMILGQISVGFIVQLIQSIEDDKDKIAAKQAKLSLDIANKTLPYFRNINSDSLNKICTIIRDDIKVDAVSITDTKNILAYIGVGKEYYNIGHEIITEVTKEAINNDKIIIRNNGLQDKSLMLKSAIIIPLKVKNEVIGALKIYYKTSHRITYSLQALAVGLSQIISTLMEVSKVEQMKTMANKAELKALQTQINPHFLFNALNAITSFIRIDPNKARELIINLASYLRYNLELNSEFIDIRKELKQVKDYIEIEKARFGNKLNIVYDIDDIDIEIPSLTIQPLVENAIIHGILKDKGAGTVKIIVKDKGEKVKISIIDSGIGISEEVIRNIYNDAVPKNKIGLYNVHLRIKLIYGEGLIIKRLEKGTKIEFYIKKK